MKKDSNRNNLIQKQLKIITKKEEKLLKESNDNYIKNKISPIKDKIEGMVPDKLQSTLELAFQKGFKVVFDKGTAVIEKTYNKENINMEYDINTYAVNKYPTRKNLRKIDKSTNKKTIFNKSLTIVEGSALGLLGIGLPDIPIYIGVILKSIYENEVEVKEISVLKSLFIIIMFTLIPGIINFLYVFLIIIGYILIREAILFDVLSQFEGPISEDDIDFFIDNAETIEVVIFGFLMYFQTLITAPIFEELLFRGIILNGLLNKYKNSSKKAIIYSAMVFGLVHLNIPQGINAFIGGIILGFIYCYTKSMKLSIFAHFINNLITFVPVPESLIFKFIYIVIGTYVIMKGIKYIRNTKLINISKAS